MILSNNLQYLYLHFADMFDVFETSKDSLKRHNNLSIVDDLVSKKIKPVTTPLPSQSNVDQKDSSIVGGSVPAPSSVDANFVPAKTYKFKLDGFQQEAVNYIERGESVLVVTILTPIK